MKTVIIPTLNEEANIGRLIPLIYRNMGDEEVSVVVVDDDSTDDTCGVVESLSRSYNIRLLERSGLRGISSAVRDAARFARNGHVAVMDADFSHDPKYLPEFFRNIEQGYDIAVGSRYVPGGGVDGWPRHRVVLSLGATLIAKALLRVGVKDPMSGFAAFKSNQILVDGIGDSESKFLLDILAYDRSLKVVEVPIVFSNRRLGSSKLNRNILLGYLGQVGRQFILNGKGSPTAHSSRMHERRVDSAHLSSFEKTEFPLSLRTTKGAD
ncbi:MAG: glycosyltransferase [Candidatus Thorarchaeota archaeon]